MAGDASLQLQLSATNAVMALALLEDSLPPDGVLPAGGSCVLQAEVRLVSVAQHRASYRQGGPGSGRGGCSGLKSGSGMHARH